MIATTQPITKEVCTDLALLIIDHLEVFWSKQDMPRSIRRLIPAILNLQKIVDELQYVGKLEDPERAADIYSDALEMYTQLERLAFPELLFPEMIEKTGAQKYQDTPWYLGHCPFHDDKRPSMYLSEDRFQCMSCGAKGDLAKLAAKLEAADKPD